MVMNDRVKKELEALLEASRKANEEVFASVTRLNYAKPKAIPYSPNLHPEKAKEVWHRTWQEADTRQRREYLAMFSAFNKQMEGEITKFYKPSSKSGWTIGQGVDLSALTPEQARELGMPARLIKYALNKGAFGTTSVPVGRSPVMDPEDPQWKKFIANVNAPYVETMVKIKEAHPQLSDRVVTALAQAKHWAGSLSNTTTDYFDKPKGQGGSYPKLFYYDKETGKYGNVIDAVLSRDNITDEDVIKSFYAAKRGLENYWTGSDEYPQNKRTYQRYINFMVGGDPDMDVDVSQFESDYRPFALDLLRKGGDRYAYR
jgi:hypothetical protein